MQLPGAFSPLNAIKQVGNYINPTTELANYDVFGNLGDQRIGDSQPLQSGDPSFSMGYHPSINQQATHPNGFGVLANTPSGFEPSATSDYSGSTATSGGSTGLANPQSIAYYDSLINNANSGFGRLDNQQQIGHDNILNSYNDAFNKLSGGKSTADRNYAEGKAQSGRDNVVAKNSIDSNVGQTANSLQRLLGRFGAGNSSAAEYANYAAARQGSQQRQGVSDTFGRNQQSMDQNYGDYTQNYNLAQNDLSRQRDQNYHTNDASIASNRANLMAQIGGLQSQRSLANGQTYAQSVAAAQPYQDQVQSLQTESDNLGRQAPIVQGQQVAYNAPTLDSYKVNQLSAPGLGRPSAATDSASPYLSMLLAKDKQTNQLGY